VSLVWLGAVTYLEGAYKSGRDQARVAIAGPLTSCALGLVLALALFLPVSLESKKLVMTLAAFNLALAALNLIPANPLDGYRLLIGVLWSALGSEQSARRLLQRLTATWLAIELVGTCALLFERPALGATVLAMAVCLFAQSRFVDRAALRSRRSTRAARGAASNPRRQASTRGSIPVYVEPARVALSSWY
jgi:Zn-dependent protease